jgi:hypothetical protein
MSPERLAEIRQAYERWDSINWVHETVAIADKVPELLEYVDELTRQLSDARRIAINSGIFQDHRGQDYDLDTE